MVCLSWWPKQYTFMNSGAWLGYWSQDCEDWYQCRCAAIRAAYFDYTSRKVSPDDLAAPKVGHKWQNALKWDRASSKLRSANTAAAKAFLDSQADLALLG